MKTFKWDLHKANDKWWLNEITPLGDHAPMQIINGALDRWKQTSCSLNVWPGGVPIGEDYGR